MCLVGGSGLSVGDTVTVLDGREWELSILQLLVCWPSVTECESKVLAVVSKVDSTNCDITSDCDKGSVATRIGFVDVGEMYTTLSAALLRRSTELVATSPINEVVCGVFVIVLVVVGSTSVLLVTLDSVTSGTSGLV